MPMLPDMDVTNMTWCDIVEGAPVAKKGLRGPTTGGPNDLWRDAGGQ